MVKLQLEWLRYICLLYLKICFFFVFWYFYSNKGTGERELQRRVFATHDAIRRNKKKKSRNASKHKVGSARLTKWCVTKLAHLEIFKTFYLGMENG
jgi:cbb3-type cytochrome oxidase subunit 3